MINKSLSKNLYYIYQGTPSSFDGRNPIFPVSEDLLIKLTKKHLEGGGHVKHYGETYYVSETTFKIYLIRPEISDDPQYVEDYFKKKSNLYHRGNYPKELINGSDGTDVTNEIFDRVNTERKDTTLEFQDIPKVETENYVNLDRIIELKSLTSSKFDFTKLIRLCEELNSSYSKGNYFAVGMLLRAIKDHVPPLFDCGNFSMVANNYKGSDSFKRLMKHLENSMKNIADAFLHQQIRRSEDLPKRTQVEFKADLDALLGEVFRIYKNGGV